MSKPPYARVLVKVSGEALLGGAAAGIDQAILRRVADDLVATRRAGAEVAVVVGGGNIFRGVTVSAQGLPRATGDVMGMLATVMNSLALETAINQAGAAGGAGLEARTLSAIAMPQVCETYERAAALRHLQAGRIVILAGGTANPFFTTDTTAVLRACELGCDAVFKATNVDGVYSADPRQDAQAVRYDRLSHDEAFARDLKVMDATAFALARENRMPIIVFSMAGAGAITDAVAGRGRATIVSGAARPAA
jgi:uridylate kinase